MFQNLGEFMEFMDLVARVDWTMRIFQPLLEHFGSMELGLPGVWFRYDPRCDFHVFQALASGNWTVCGSKTSDHRRKWTMAIMHPTVRKIYHTWGIWALIAGGFFSKKRRTKNLQLPRIFTFTKAEEVSSIFSPTPEHQVGIPQMIHWWKKNIETHESICRI